MGTSGPDGTAASSRIEDNGTRAPGRMLTLLLTEVEHHASLLDLGREQLVECLEGHSELVQSVVKEGGGQTLSNAGGQVSTVSIFDQAADAVASAVRLQELLFGQSWPGDLEILVRVAVHSGEAFEANSEFVGPTFNRGVRLRDMAHGGQILCSETTAALAQAALPDGVELVDLGEYWIRELQSTVRVFEIRHPGLCREFPPLRSEVEHLSNLPPQRGTFVGRDDEMHQILDSLKIGRLVTLTGVPGVGKTRLALQVCAELLPAYKDGVWVVDLGGLTDDSAVPEAVAGALGVRQVPDQTTSESVLSFLGNKCLLLVVDNCEHILDSTSRFLEAILGAALGVKIVATSRQSLHIPGEQIVVVRPFDVANDANDPEVVEKEDAVRLFVDRARAVRVQFRLTAQNAEAVARLCRRLEGLPLAIELAAARVQAMTPTEIASRLDQCFDLLADRPSGIGRHRTLREAIDWSYHLLTDAERRLLRRLSICAGGFDLETAEALGADEHLDGSEVAHVLASLVDKSLVIADDLGGESRYRILDTIREYGRHQLEGSGELDAARISHAHTYFAFAAEVGRQLKGPAERASLKRVERELDNLRVAIAYALEVDEVRLALEAVEALGLQGLRIEPAVGSWAEAIVRHPSAEADPRYPVALAFLAWRRLRVGQRDDAERYAAEAVARLGANPEDDSVVCRVLAATTGIAATLGKNPGDQARTLLASARALGDVYEEALALIMVATVELIAGNPGAISVCEESVRVARSSGSPTAIAYALHGLSLYSAEQDPAGSLNAIEEARLFAEASLNDFALILVEATRSALLSKSGAHEAAAAAFLDSARRAFHDGLRDSQAWSLWGVAGSLAAAHHPEPAVVLKGWVESFLGPGDNLLNLNLRLDAAEAITAIPNHLGTDRCKEMAQAGAAMTDETVLRYAEEAVSKLDGTGHTHAASPENFAGVSTMSPAGGEVERLAGQLFIGRDKEMAQISWTLEAAKAGRGALVVLSGEAGIGKTRLAEQIDTKAQARGFSVVWGRCWDVGGAPAYWPWIQVLRALLRQHGNAELVERSRRAGLIAQILPELAETIPDLAPPNLVEPDSARFALFEAVFSCLAAVADEAPLVIIFDDLHGADHASILLLRFAVAELRDHPILIVGTCRNEHTSASQDTDRLLRETIRRGQRLSLSGLSESEVAALIETAAGAAPTSTVATAVYKATEGNPFFVHEMTALLGEQQRLTATRAPERLMIPSGVRDAITQRIAQLPPHAQEILNEASVIGRTFDVDLLEQMSDKTRGQLLDALVAATQERIVTEVLRSLGRYNFTHTLIRETLYDSLSPTRRGRLHGRIADALEELHGNDPRSYISELAYHAYEAAATGGDAERALDLSIAAGRQAIASLAYEEALAYFQRAQRLLATTSRPDRQRCELLLLTAEALKAAGEGTEAREMYARAGEVARQAADPTQLAQAALGWGGDVGLTGGMVDTRLLTLLEEALTALPDEDSTFRARLLARIALERLFAGNPHHVAELSSEAINVARRIGDPATLAYSLHARSFTLLGADDAEQRRQIAPEIVNLASAAGDVQLAVDGHGWQIQTCLELGDKAGAIEAIEAIDRLTDELGQPRYNYWADVFRATLALVEGRIGEAERLAEKALSTGQGPFETNAPLIYGAQLFAIRREQGRLGELAELVEGFIGSQPGLPVWRAGLALAWLEAGQPQYAHTQLEHLARDRFASLPRDLNWLLALVLLAEVTAGLEDEQNAKLLWELLNPHAGRNLAVVQGIYYAGSVDYYRGILAGTLGHEADAVACLEAAERAHQDLGARAWLARTWYQLGRVLLRVDGERAHTLLDRACSHARDMGMDRLASDADHARREPITPAAAAPTDSKSVLRRDGELWEISYQGRTIRVRDVRGLRYLAHLLEHPGREYHVRELLGAAAEPGAAVRAIAPDSDAGPVLDGPAKRAYRQRLIDLREDLDEAENWGDQERAARAREEIQTIAAQLASAVGLGGRDRRAGAQAERARSAVTKRIHDAIQRISAQNETLGRHLRASIRTGYFCAYTADDSEPAWQVEA